MKAIIVFTTCPDVKTARKISQELLKRKLAACVSILPKIESGYWWKNKIEKSSEALLIIKSHKNMFNNLEKTIKLLHPYKIPEILMLKIEMGNKSYLEWMSQVIK